MTENKEPSREPHWVSQSCGGEHCLICKADATHKIEEVIFDDEPFNWKMRHPLTAYLCCAHFTLVTGRGCGYASV